MILTSVCRSSASVVSFSASLDTHYFGLGTSIPWAHVLVLTPHLVFCIPPTLVRCLLLGPYLGFAQWPGDLRPRGLSCSSPTARSLYPLAHPPCGVPPCTPCTDIRPYAIHVLLAPLHCSAPWSCSLSRGHVSPCSPLSPSLLPVAAPPLAYCTFTPSPNGLGTSVPWARCIPVRQLRHFSLWSILLPASVPPCTPGDIRPWHLSTAPLRVLAHFPGDITGGPLGRGT